MARVSGSGFEVKGEGIRVERGGGEESSAAMLSHASSSPLLRSCLELSDTKVCEP